MSTTPPRPPVRPVTQRSGFEARVTPEDAGPERLAAIAARMLDVPFAALVVGRGDAAIAVGIHAPDGFTERFPLAIALGVVRRGETTARPAAVVLDELPAGEAAATVAIRSAVAMPVASPRDGVLGALVVLETRARRWSVAEVDALADLSAVAVSVAAAAARKVDAPAPSVRDREAAAEAKRLAHSLADHRVRSRLLHELSLLVIHGGADESVIDRALERMCAAFSWCLPRAHVGFDLARAGGLVAQVAATGRPAWVHGIDAVAAGDRRRAAQAQGVRTCLAFPVQSGGVTLAVLELCSPETETLDDALLATLHDVGQLLARVVARQSVARGIDQSSRGLLGCRARTMPAPRSHA